MASFVFEAFEEAVGVVHLCLEAAELGDLQMEVVEEVHLMLMVVLVVRVEQRKSQREQHE